MGRETLAYERRSHEGPLVWPHVFDRLSTPAVCAALILAYSVLVVLFFSTCTFAYKHLERPIIDCIYGSQAYAAGLRIVGRHGELSDGRRLPTIWSAARGLGSYIVSMPVWLGYVGILAFLGLFPPDRILKERQK
jgi:hypothetical protein